MVGLLQEPLEMRKKTVLRSKMARPLGDNREAGMKDDFGGFESLKVFFQIVKRESTFKVQIITLESLETFESALVDGGVRYVKQFSSGVSKINRPILILRDSSIDVSTPGKYILFSNIRHKDFVQILFRPTLEEKLSIIGDEYIVRAYNYKNISELRMIVDNNGFKLDKYFGSGLDYFESVIMFIVMNRCKFSDILSGVMEVDSGLDNPFLLQIKLNGLVNKLFILRSGDSYRINVSEEALKSISRKIGFNVDAIRQTRL